MLQKIFFVGKQTNSKVDMGSLYKYTGKRLIDICIAFTVLLISSPLLLIILISLFALSRQNPLFIQKRPGLHQKLFKLYKVKTLYGNSSVPLSKLCLFLRRYSLDEIPQFINVLLGDMSVIGPRPLLAEYVPLYNSFQLRRHEIRPGITGWAQINGRNAIPWSRRFALDVWYVDHLSFRLDASILLQTILKLFSTENVREEGLQEHEKFAGNSFTAIRKVPNKTIPKGV